MPRMVASNHGNRKRWGRHMSEDDQRAAFEAWAKSRNAPIDITANVYHNVSVEFAWLAWQAAIEHARLNPQADTQLATTHVPAP